MVDGIHILFLDPQSALFLHSLPSRAYIPELVVNWRLAILNQLLMNGIQNYSKKGNDSNVLKAWKLLHNLLNQFIWINKFLVIIKALTVIIS